MKLFLTSIGLPNKKVRKAFLGILPKKPKLCSVLLIAYIRTKEEEKFLTFLKKEMTKTHITNISFFNLNKESFFKTKESQKTYDIIYMSGGSTFEMLERIRKTGIDKFIKKYLVKKDVIYFAMSAGSIIAGPNIETAGWGSEADDNPRNLKKKTGLKLTQFAVFPHHKKKLKKEVASFQNKVSYPIIPLTDKQAVLIEGKKYKVIG